ncbi:MAG: sugar ABC transporter permease [Verrucomicrobia bacterium]|nr:sugar ABC transporter permease [Verrucomicrobiota bacterium]
MPRFNLQAIGFLAPSLLGVTLFFLLPVLLTVVFAFTNMSTSTGILGGDYMLTQVQLPRLAQAGISKPTVTRLQAAGYAITEETLAAFAAVYGQDRADELKQGHEGATFTSNRDLERVLKELPRNPIRKVSDRKAALQLLSVSVLGDRFKTAEEFQTALRGMGIDPQDQDGLTKIAYTGWTYTTANFELLFELPATLRYALNTTLYVVCTLIFNVTFGLFLAIATFYLPKKLANTFQVIWFLPRILPPVLYILMWTWFTWDNGFLSNLFGLFGVPPRNWMQDTATNAWIVVILINGFVGASLGMILFASAIKSIPSTLLYAAEVDGASRWQQVLYIILPQLRWPILFLTSYQTLSLLTSFEYILLATNGGPGRTTEVWALAAYHTALSNYGGNLEYGFGAAYALVLVFIGISLSLLYMRFFNFNDLVAKPRIEQ